MTRRTNREPAYETLGIKKKNAPECVIREHRENKRAIGYYIWDEPYFDDRLDEARMLTDI